MTIENCYYCGLFETFNVNATLVGFEVSVFVIEGKFNELYEYNTLKIYFGSCKSINS